jgi:hypothetical protein
MLSVGRDKCNASTDFLTKNENAEGIYIPLIFKKTPKIAYQHLQHVHYVFFDYQITTEPNMKKDDKAFQPCRLFLEQLPVKLRR